MATRSQLCDNLVTTLLQPSNNLVAVVNGVVINELDYM